MTSRLERVSGVSRFGVPSLDPTARSDALTKARKAAFSEKWRSYACLSKKSEEIFQRTHRERVITKMAPRTRFSKVAEANGLTIDILSVTRNSLLSGATFKGAETVAKVISAYSGLTIAGGALGVFSGLNLVRNGASKLMNDYQNANWEGGFDNGALAAIGVVYATLSSGLVISNSASLAGSIATAAAGGLLTTVAGSGLYGIVAIWSGYGITANHLFQKELNDHESQGTFSTMKWLADQVRDASSESQLKKQWDRFAFRTSEACCRLVRETVTPEFLERVESKDLSALREARFIIQEVKKANSKQLMKHYLFMTIAVLGLAAMAIGLLFATGPFSPLLFAIGALIWITVDSSKVHEKLGDLFFGQSQIPEAKIPQRVALPALEAQKEMPWLKSRGAAQAVCAS